MKRAVVVASGLIALGFVLAAAPGCAASRAFQCMFFKGNCISYDQYLSVDQSAVPTPTAEAVLQSLGNPMAVHDRNGIRRSIDYHAYSLTGELKIAVFTFDDNEKLVKKELW
jgi:hypothetical protein